MLAHKGRSNFKKLSEHFSEKFEINSYRLFLPLREDLFKFFHLLRYSSLTNTPECGALG